MVSMFLILVRVFQRTKKYVAVIIASIIFMIIQIENIVLIQWTLAAGVLTMTAIFWVMTQPNYLSSIKKYIDYSIAIVILLLAYNIRGNVVIMAAPFAALVWSFNFLNEKSVCSKKTLIKYSIFPIVVVIGIVCVGILHKNAYDTEEWNKYDQYMSSRSSLVDYYGYPNYKEHKEIYDTLGISKEVYTLLKSDYNIVLDDNINEETIIRLSEYAKQQYHEKNTLRYRMKNAVFTMYNTFVSEEYALINYFIIMVTLVCIFYAIKNQRLIFAIYIFCLHIGNMIIWLYLTLKGRMPYRVGYTLLCVVLIILLGWILQNRKLRNSMRFNNDSNIVKKLCIVFSMVLLLGIMVLNNWKVSEKSNSYEDKVRSKIEWYEFASSNTDKFYFTDFYSFLNYPEPFYAEVEKMQGNTLSFGGWYARNPLYYQKLQDYGIKDIKNALISQDNVYYVCLSSRTKTVQNIVNYYKSINVSVKASKVDSIKVKDGATYLIYQFAKK